MHTTVSYSSMPHSLSMSICVCPSLQTDDPSSKPFSPHLVYQWQFPTYPGPWCSFRNRPTQRTLYTLARHVEIPFTSCMHCHEIYHSRPTDSIYFEIFLTNFTDNQITRGQSKTLMRNEKEKKKVAIPLNYKIGISLSWLFLCSDESVNTFQSWLLIC